MSWIDQLPDPEPLDQPAIEQLLVAVGVLVAITKRSHLALLNSLRARKIISTESLEEALILLDVMDPD